MALSIEEELMSDLTRAEIEEFWETWLEINREAERTGDWRIMADWYAEDATYGWMYTPDEHFMAVGREQIRDWAIGIEMDGLDGWHYDYQCTMIDEAKGDGASASGSSGPGSSTTRPARSTRSSASAARGSASSGRPTATPASSPGSATGSTSASTAHTFLAIAEVRQGARQRCSTG